MNDISKRRNAYWRASIILFSSLLFFLLNWLPVTAQVARTSLVFHEVAPTVIQSTPTVDPTVTALNKQKLENDTSWWWNNTVPLITSLVTILSLLGGGIFTVIRVTGEQQANREGRKEEHDQRLQDRQTEREKRDEEQQRWLQDREVEREKRDEQRFQSVVEGLGGPNQATQVGAAITLRTFLSPGYEQFYRQVFDLAVAHLRLRNVDSDNAEPLDSLNQALIAIFNESFPLIRQQLKDTKYMQQLDATQVQLDHAYLAGADLQSIWMPLAYLRETNLSGATLSGANLSGANLSKATLIGVTLREAHLREAHLREAHLREADLSGAHLSDADLSGAELFGAHLSDANLTRAHLTRAKLILADLSDANLTGADLSEADLSEADLSEADLSEASLQNVKTWTKTELLNVKGLNQSQLAEFQTKGAIIEEKNEETM